MVRFPDPAQPPGCSRQGLKGSLPNIPLGDAGRKFPLIRLDSRKSYGARWTSTPLMWSEGGAPVGGHRLPAWAAAHLVPDAGLVAELQS
eukprot:14501611-Heterocapsa_arctica.AAC.1